MAIKILPRAFIADPDRLARFQREARVLAALNHPNIATIHGIEETGGISALVMELVDGATLAERIAQGRVGVREALASRGRLPTRSTRRTKRTWRIATSSQPTSRSGRTAR